MPECLMPRFLALVHIVIRLLAYITLVHPQILYCGTHSQNLNSNNYIHLQQRPSENSSLKDHREDALNHGNTLSLLHGSPCQLYAHSRGAKQPHAHLSVHERILTIYMCSLIPKSKSRSRLPMRLRFPEMLLHQRVKW
jgi:hypothetical protein